MKNNIYKTCNRVIGIALLAVAIGYAALLALTIYLVNAMQVAIVSVIGSSLDYGKLLSLSEVAIFRNSSVGASNNSLLAFAYAMCGSLMLLVILCSFIGVVGLVSVYWFCAPRGLGGTEAVKQDVV